MAGPEELRFILGSGHDRRACTGRIRGDDATAAGFAAAINGRAVAGRAAQRGVTGVVIEHPSYLDLYDKQLNLVDLRLYLTGTHVVIQVWDADPTPTWPQDPAPGQARCRRNFYLPPHGGKVVWVALEIPPAVLHEGTRRSALPWRAGYPRPVPPAPVRPVDAMTDPALLERVRDGLHRLETNKPPGDGPTTQSTVREEG